MNNRPSSQQLAEAEELKEEPSSAPPNPLDPPAGEPSAPPQQPKSESPSPVPDQPKSELPRSPGGSLEPSDNGIITDSDSDNDNMSKATKAFDKVTMLKGDRSNWDTWKTRVERAAKSIKYKKYFKYDVTRDTVEFLAAEEKLPTC